MTVLDAEGALTERHTLIWRFSDDLWITVLWGAPDQRDVSRALEAYEIVKQERGRFRAFLDFSRLEHVDPEAFSRLALWMSEARESLEPRVVWQACVIPKGMLGALVSGFHSALGYKIRTEYFDSTESALTAMFDPAEREALRARLIPRLEALATSVLLERMRTALRQKPRSTIDEIAAVLAVSRRSLQRELKSAGTSFIQQRLEARIDLAKEQLRAGDSKIEALAQDLGFLSRQQFTRQFTRLVGISPSEFRENKG